MSSLLSGEDHHRVARQLKTQEISGAKLDATTLLFGPAGNDTQPARFLPIETTLLSTGLVAIELNEGVGIPFTLSSLEDNVLVE
jgi:hypothetical protein